MPYTMLSMSLSASRPLFRAILLCALTPLAGWAAIPSAPAPAAIPAQSTAATPKGGTITRNEIDRLLRDARQLHTQGETAKAQAMMLEAAQRLQQTGYERDKVSILREMTLDSDPAFVSAGSKAMAEHYYQKYLTTKPRDAQWLLEALAWGHYAGDETLLKRFSARVPDKSHENIDERGKQRGLDLKADDRLYLASEMIRLNQIEELKKQLKDWPYPIDRIHSIEGTSLLHNAVWHKKTGIARMLVEEYKANVNVVDKENDTPLDYAHYKQATDLVQYLTSKGGKANKDYSKTAPAAKRIVGQPSLDTLKMKNPDVLKLPSEQKKPAQSTQPAKP